MAKRQIGIEEPHTAGGPGCAEGGFICDHKLCSDFLAIFTRCFLPTVWYYILAKGFSHGCPHHTAFDSFFSSSRVELPSSRNPLWRLAMTRPLSINPKLCGLHFVLCCGNEQSQPPPSNLRGLSSFESANGFWEAAISVRPSQYRVPSGSNAVATSRELQPASISCMFSCARASSRARSAWWSSLMAPHKDGAVKLHDTTEKIGMRLHTVASGAAFLRQYGALSIQMSCQRSPCRCRDVVLRMHATLGVARLARQW